MDPELPEVLHALGVARALRGDVGHGAELIAAALEREDPALRGACAEAGDFLARASIAFLLLAQERFAAAEAALAALTTHPLAGGAHLAVLVDRLGLARALRGKRSEARACFQRAVQLDKENRDAAAHLMQLRLEEPSPACRAPLAPVQGGGGMTPRKAPSRLRRRLWHLARRLALGGEKAAR